MPACRFPVHLPCLVCLCSIAVGCVTEQSKPDGSFTTGGPGQYGQPAPSTAPPPTITKSGSKKEYVPSPRLRLAEAVFLEKRGYTDDARKSYEKVLAAEPSSVDAVIGLARLDQVAGRTAEAEAGFLKAIKLNPNSGNPLDALGQFYVDQKRYNEGIAALQRAMAAAPDDKTYRFHYAIALAKSGQIEQAVPMLVEMVGPAAMHYNIGLILHEKGDLPGSEEQFVEAVLKDSRLQAAQYWLKQVQREREQPELAVAAAPSAAQRAAGQTNGPASAAYVAPGPASPNAETAVPAPPEVPVSPLTETSGGPAAAGR